LSLPDAVPRSQPVPRDIAEALAQAAPRLGRFGHALRFYEQLPSTNDLAATLAEQDAAEGAVIVADMQTAGRGRLGRAWSSPPGAGLYVSTVLRPRTDVVSLITLAAGVAIAEGVLASTGLRTALKWPNDVMVLPARKLAGILAESGHGGAAHPGCVVLGFGINLRPAAYPPDIAARATSIEGELGRPVDRGLVLIECLAALRSQYDDLHSGRRAAVLERWRGYARPLLGRRVEFDAGVSRTNGVAEDVDESGALIVRTAEGAVRVISGEVRWM
jgi:BirA family biotin operon repressor/biotin-[acetyl-CoA-carboxylase] ligase